MITAAEAKAYTQDCLSGKCDVAVKDLVLFDKIEAAARLGDDSITVVINVADAKVKFPGLDLNKVAMLFEKLGYSSKTKLSEDKLTVTLYVSWDR